jgi:hypothetical protein
MQVIVGFFLSRRQTVRWRNKHKIATAALTVGTALVPMVKISVSMAAQRAVYRQWILRRGKMNAFWHTIVSIRKLLINTAWFPYGKQEIYLVSIRKLRMDTA